MPYLDTLKLSFGNNLILGHSPEGLPMDKVGEKMEKELTHMEDIEAFGLFDSNTANYNTFYPGVTAEDLVPKDSDFIQPIFRALSEVIVHKEYNPVDFGENKALKKSMSLLLGSTINVDHETIIGNALGAVKEVSWQNSYKTEGGIIVPAGINAKLKIDGKSNPKVARGIMMDPPSIHSTSVTVQFLWDKSHANLTQEEFFAKVGSIVDNKLVRRIATEVKRYHEISLVSHGADPYAQLVKDAKIVNPVWGNISYNSVSGPDKQKQNYFFFDCKTDIIHNSIPAQSNIETSNTEKDNNMNKTFLIALAALVGYKLSNAEEPTELDETGLQDHIAQLVNTNQSNTELLANNTTEITRLQEVETAYNAEKATLANATALQAFKDAETNKLRERVKTAYGLVSNDNNAESVMNKMITGASYETLTALNIQYTATLEEKFQQTCKKCGSTEINRASAKVENTSGDKKEVDRESLKKLARNKTHGIKMHDTFEKEEEQ